MCPRAAATLLIDMKSYPQYEAFLLLLLIDYVQHKPASAEMFFESATPLQQYLSLWLCYGYCCLVIGCRIHVWNQNSLNLAGFLFLWEEYRGRYHFHRGTKSSLFALHPNEQFNLQEHLSSHAKGSIQRRGQDSLLSLIDGRITILLEPQNQISPHLKWDCYNTVESILTYPRVRISWSSKALLCCWEACIVDPCSSPLAS